LYIEDYFQKMRQVIEDCPAVTQFSIDAEKRDTYEGFIRAEIRFANGAILQVREFVAVETGIERDMYAYQYMSAEQALIFRYDNTPHHRKLNLSTFPHHQHVGSETNVLASNAPMLGDVLAQIQAQLEQGES
jgi:Family of unknown function (DUF6516)